MPEPVEKPAVPPTARERSWGFWKELGTPVLAAFASLLSVLVGVFASVQDANVKQLRVQLDGVEQATSAQRLARIDREALNFKLFEAVRTSLASKNENEQRAVAALVTTLADSAFAGDLLAAMRQQAEPRVQGEIGEQLSATKAFDVEQAAAAAAPKPPPVLPGTALAAAPWRCDVFWVSRGGAGARRVAEQARARLGQEWSSVALRVRELPDLVNARDGYRVAGYEIRYDRDEAKRAARMKELLDPLVEGSGRFALRQVGTPTPGYLSVFVNP